jgi:hypothetical protein
VVEYVLSMGKAQGSIPSTKTKQKPPNKEYY